MRHESTQIQDLKNRCEGLIRQGEFGKARALFESLDLAQIPRIQTAEIARLARRCGAWGISLKILKPLVRPEVKGPDPATESERLEYGLALQNVGAFREAQLLFSEIAPTQEPRVWLALAFQKMAEWNYLEAFEFLERYTGAKGLSEYEILVGRVNGLACLSHHLDARSEREFSSLEPELKKQNLGLLHGNTLEIMAQYWLHQGRVNEASEALEKARKLLQSEQGVQFLFVEKWQCILNALKSKSTTGLNEFRKRALEENHWETLRDLDYFQTVLDPECVWADNVYFGTPFISFRKRLEQHREYPGEKWICRSGDGSQKLDPWFPGQDEGGIAHRFMVLLLSDFYRPFRIGQIYSSLYEGEYFDLMASTDRVRQLSSRTRKWINELNLPLDLKVVDGNYAIRMKENASVLCRQRSLGFDRLQFLFGRFAAAEMTDLSADGWADRLKVTKTKIKHLLTEAQATGVLEKGGEARYSVYRLKP